MRCWRHLFGGNQLTVVPDLSNNDINNDDTQSTPRPVRSTPRPSKDNLRRIRLRIGRDHPALQFRELLKLHYGCILLASTRPSFPSLPTRMAYVSLAWKRAAMDLRPHGLQLSEENLIYVSLISTTHF